jgi:hypothetical protein
MTVMTLRALGLVTALVMALPVPAAAQRATVTLSPKVVMFPSSDPDTVPLVIAAPIQVTYQIQGGGKNITWALTVLADGDLLDGSSSVDITNVTWVATPAPPFQNGTLSQTVAQVVATGTGQVNPAQNASIAFRLANSWLYRAGNYTQTVVFTLSLP